MCSLWTLAVLIPKLQARFRVHAAVFPPVALTERNMETWLLSDGKLGVKHEHVWRQATLPGTRMRPGDHHADMTVPGLQSRHRNVPSGAMQQCKSPAPLLEWQGATRKVRAFTIRLARHQSKSTCLILHK